MILPRVAKIPHREPKRERRSRSSRDLCPVQCTLCRYRHNTHYAAFRIMPGRTLRAPESVTFRRGCAAQSAGFDEGEQLTETMWQRRAADVLSLRSAINLHSTRSHEFQEAHPTVP